MQPGIGLCACKAWPDPSRDLCSAMYTLLVCMPREDADVGCIAFGSSLPQRSFVLPDRNLLWKVETRRACEEVP
jgi:hypothetical protein